MSCTLGDDVASSVFDEKVNVIACDYVIEHAQTEPLLRFEKPIQITAAIAHPDFSGDFHDVIFINVLNEAQRLNDWNDWNKLSWVVVSDMPNITGE